MGENSKIEWTDHTWNPWIGCTRVSQGCVNCYAEALAKRYGKAEWGPAAQRVRTSADNWRKPLQWNRKAEREGRRYKVFCASLADVFEDNDQVAWWRAELFDMIASTPNLDWLLLTKRPENIIPALRAIPVLKRDNLYDHLWLKGRFPNVWLGTSVENQAMADKRIPILAGIPAAVRFLSCEPLLGPVDLSPYMGGEYLTGVEWGGMQETAYEPPDVHWVIVGGESGPKARQMEADWVRSVRDQCNSAGVAFFVKQMGGVRDKRGELSDLPEDLRIREYPEGAYVE